MDPRLQRLFDLCSQALEQEQALYNTVTMFRQRIEQEMEIERVKKLLAVFASNYEDQRSALRKLMDEIYGLIKELMESGVEPAPTESTSVRPNAIADQFRNLMDTIQQKARQPSEGETATTLKNMEIELKGLVVVEEDEARIVPPAPGSQVDPGLLSTIHLSFGSIPVLRPQPAQSPPTSTSPTPTSPTSTSPAPAQPTPTHLSSSPQTSTAPSRRKRKKDSNE
jgi:hypothetical protein